MKDALPFGTLFSLSWQRILRLKKSLLLPAIVSSIFGALQGVVGFAGDGEQLRLEDLQSLASPLSFIPTVSAQDWTADIAMGASAGVLIAIVLFLVLLLIISTYIAFLYSLLVVYDEYRNFGETLKRSAYLLVPYIGLSVWVFLRSFVWVPMLGILGIILLILPSEGKFDSVMIGGIVLFILALLILALYYFPRLSFTQVIYFKEKVGIFAAASESLKRSSGYWWKIVGNGILFALIVLLIGGGLFLSFFLTVLLGSVVVVPLMLMGWTIAGVMLGALGLFVLFLILNLTIQYLQYWGQSFHYELARTVFENPKV